MAAVKICLRQQSALVMQEQTPSVLLKIQDLEKRFGYVVQMLVLALFGPVVEACIIYRLHTHSISENVSVYNSSYEVGFTAALQPSSWGQSGYGKIGPFESEITLIHNKVLTNVGGAYSNGVFTAPVKGVYFFTFTTYSWVAEKDIGVKLMKNNEEVLLIWETQDRGDNEDYASNSVLLELVVGDKVYMRLPSGYQVAASIWSNIHTFSGFLLYSRSNQ